MSEMASQITNHKIVYSTVYSGTDQRKHQSSVSLALCAGNSPVTGEFPAQMANNLENVSIWWCHHALCLYMTGPENLSLWRPPTDVLESNGAMPSAGSLLNEELYMLTSKFLHLSVNLYHLHGNKNGNLIMMTALVFTGDVEACLQRLQWILGLSTRWPFHFNKSDGIIQKFSRNLTTLTFNSLWPSNTISIG